MVCVDVLPTRDDSAKAAAAYVAKVVRDVVAAKGGARVIFATGASQFEFLQHLVATEGLPWDKVEAFHLDEYVGLPITHGASFRGYLQERLFSKVSPAFKAVNLLDPAELGAYGAGEDLEASNFDVAARRARDKRKATRTEHAHKVSCAVLVRIACSARTRRDATTCCPIPLHQRGRAHVEVTDRAARYSATCVVTDGRAHAGEQLEGRHARTPGLFTHAARGNVVISFCSTQ